jgi:hypothetical protein
MGGAGADGGAGVEPTITVDANGLRCGALLLCPDAGADGAFRGSGFFGG